MKNLAISLVCLFFGGMSAFAHTPLDCTDLIDMSKYVGDVDSVENVFGSQEIADYFYTLGVSIIFSQQEEYPILSSFVIEPSKLEEKSTEDVESYDFEEYIEEKKKQLVEMSKLSGDKCKEKKEALNNELDKLKKDFKSKESKKALVDEINRLNELNKSKENFSEKGINDIDFSKVHNYFMAQAIFNTHILDILEGFGKAIGKAAGEIAVKTFEVLGEVVEEAVEEAIEKITDKASNDMDKILDKSGEEALQNN